MRIACVVGLLTALPVLAAILAVSPTDAALRRAPAFTLPLLTGKTLSLADLGGSPAILLFFAPWCPTCNAEARSWEREYQTWKGKGVALVGIGLLDTRPAVEQFVSRYRLTFPVGYDAGGQIAKAYGFTVQPFWAWIGRDGRLLRASYGPSDGAELGAAIRSLVRR